MQTKLFIGTRMIPDLKPCLDQLQGGLKLIPFQGKEYLGFYIQDCSPTVLQLRDYSRGFIDQIQSNLPHVRADTLPVVVFPQLFLG